MLLNGVAEHALFCMLINGVAEHTRF